MPISIEISGVAERDIDLLLLEEFVSSPSFRSWFLERLGITSAAELTAAARSVNTSSGESDLELTLQVDDQALKVLIENKVDAIFQPRQAERYLERATDYLKTGACAKALTVIIAPNEYFGDAQTTIGFQHRLSHQALLSWFEESLELGGRTAVKCAVLKAAISRSGRGWQLVPNEVTTGFWHHYWELAKAFAPDLRMPRPSEKPEGSSFIVFKPLGLAKNVTLLHKVSYGNVDLQFSRMGDRVLEIEQFYKDHLGPAMQVDRANRSAVVRRRVPRITMGTALAESRPLIRQGLQAALDLLSMYQKAPWRP